MEKSEASLWVGSESKHQLLPTRELGLGLGPLLLADSPEALVVDLLPTYLSSFLSHLLQVAHPGSCQNSFTMIL